MYIVSSVTSIGHQAFLECSSLTSITIPDGVTYIGQSAFAWCINLTSIDIPDSVISFGIAVFADCSKLTGTINVPNGVTNIGEAMFSNCESLTSLTIPSSVKSIGDYAFRNCHGLPSLNIPDSVTSIGMHAFSGCTGLEQYEYDAAYVGKWFTQCYGFITELTLRSNTVGIAGGVFFDSGTDLTSLDIPSSVLYICEKAFDGCSSLTSITFHGTMAQWNTIVQSGWNDDSAIQTVVCYDGTIIL